MDHQTLLKTIHVAMYLKINRLKNGLVKQKIL